MPLRPIRRCTQVRGGLEALPRQHHRLLHRIHLDRLFDRDLVVLGRALEVSRRVEEQRELRGDCPTPFAVVHDERVSDALQTTALVHEVFLRLVEAGSVDWQNRRHFLAVAGRTMRRVLVDLARATAADKRGAGAIHVAIDSGIPADAPEPLDFVALDRALDKLAQVDQRKVRVIELRFFAGLNVEETADVLQVSPDTVTRDWRLARSWLKRELAGSDLPR